jgi:hypothetical protein
MLQSPSFDFGLVWLPGFYQSTWMGSTSCSVQGKKSKMITEKGRVPCRAKLKFSPPHLFLRSFVRVLIRAILQNVLIRTHTKPGRVVAGMDVVRAIEAVATDENDRPGIM